MASPAARVLATTSRHRMYSSTLRPIRPLSVFLSQTPCHLQPMYRAVPKPLHQQEQQRSYLYLPTSWVEAEERFRRWTESAKHTVVNVQLISKNKTRLNRQRWNELTKNPKRRLIKGKQRGLRILTKIRRMNQSQWNAWILSQRKNLKNSINATADSIATSINEKTPAIAPPVLPLPMSTPSSTSFSTGKSFRERYQSFKLRRQEQFQRFKSNRKEQFQRFQTRRREAWIRTKQVLVNEYSRPEWFDALGRPLVAKDSTGRFVNPWKSQSTNGIQSIATIFKWRVERMIRTWNQLGLFQSLVPRLSWNTEMPALPRPSPALPSLPDKNHNNIDNDLDVNKEEKIQLTWIGHSTCWIQMNGLTILTDPMFSLRASPYQWLPIGVPRELPPSHTIQELADHTPNGKIDLCCITHDHYDHMDEDSIKELKPHVQMWVVPLGIKKWLMEVADIDAASIVELEWWQQVHIEEPLENNSAVVAHVDGGDTDDSKRSNDSTDGSRYTTITCCPASHWASRTMMDRNFRLWCSFAFATTSTDSGQPQQRFFFCGDTGYPDFPLFRQIGDALGPFDLAAIPIGAYKPTEMMKDAHVDPWEALRIHKDLRSKRSVAIHWGTFPLSEEDMQDPPRDLKKAIADEEERAAKIGFDTALAPFTTLEHGETVEISAVSAAGGSDENEDEQENVDEVAVGV